MRLAPLVLIFRSHRHLSLLPLHPATPWNCADGLQARHHVDLLIGRGPRSRADLRPHAKPSCPGGYAKVTAPPSSSASSRVSVRPVPERSIALMPKNTSHKTIAQVAKTRVAVKPDDLGPRKKSELIKVVRAAVHFGDVPDVRLLIVESLGQAHVEVGRHDRSGKAAQNQTMIRE